MSIWLRRVQVAWAGSHTRGPAFSMTYRRRVERPGERKALVALGHEVLAMAYAVLK